MLYKDIVEFDIKIMKEMIRKYESEKDGWNAFKKFYKDPDGYPIDKDGLRTKNDIKCTADALLSIKRIYDKEGFNQDFVETFRIYRETPIIFFPRERGGINTTRNSTFGDKIDHTLFDLKQYCEGKECKLKSSYQNPKTKRWLASFSDFKDLVEWMNIEEIFVDENYNVFDLEKDGEVITAYLDNYNSKWSDNYYRNVKKKIREFKAKKVEVSG